MRNFTPGRGKIVPRNVINYYTPGRGKIVPRNINYTPGRGRIVPRNIITLLVGEKLCRVM